MASINTTEHYQNWRIVTDDDDIAWLYLDKADSSMNVLSSNVLYELEQILSVIEESSCRAIVFISEKNSSFIAGADIKEFTCIESESEAFDIIRRGQIIMDRIESLSIPAIALIKGVCLGGGMELALACSYRIAVDVPSTRLGLPEVLLGMHPGFGGSVRSCSLLGAPKAFELMLTGKTVTANNAKRIGWVDITVPERQMIASARYYALREPERRKIEWWKTLTNKLFIRKLLASQIRKKLAKKVKAEHYPAPYALIDVWEKYGDDPESMMLEEARSLAQLMVTQSTKNLIQVFFLRESLKSLGDKRIIKPLHIHVIGAGVMGGDIAAWCAYKGFTVTLEDREAKLLTPVFKRAYKLFNRRHRNNKLANMNMDKLIPDTNGYGVKKADIIIEAVYENLDTKQALFKRLEAEARPNAILATNTSSIPLDEISSVLENPERLVGIHFFNPVAQMQLIEIVSGNTTEAGIVSKACAFARHIDRLPVPVRSTAGFLVNRILMPYLMEAVKLAEEGIPVSAIDKAATGFGMPMGPILLADTVGLDICLSVGDILASQSGMNVPEILRSMVEMKHLGKKTGEGFYKYKNGKPVKTTSKNAVHKDNDITDRLIFSYLNEAVACLHDGIVQNQDHLDASMIFGTGFAPFRGGPINYIRQIGVDACIDKLKELEEGYGQRFSPGPGWNTLK